MTAPERRLPPEVQALADWRAGEAGWRRADLSRLADAATAEGLATLGGQIQIRLPQLTCELYWQDYDPGERRRSEDWPTYVERSWKEMLFLVNGLPSGEVIIEGARRLASELAELPDDEVREGLWFVVYLSAKADDPGAPRR